MIEPKSMVIYGEQPYSACMCLCTLIPNNLRDVPCDYAYLGPLGK